MPCTPCTATPLCPTPGPWWLVWGRGQVVPLQPATTNFLSQGGGITRTKWFPRWCAGMWIEGCWQRSVSYRWAYPTMAVWRSWSLTRTFTESHLRQSANDTSFHVPDFSFATASKISKWCRESVSFSFTCHFTMRYYCVCTNVSSESLKYKYIFSWAVFWLKIAVIIFP